MQYELGGKFEIYKKGLNEPLQIIYTNNDKRSGV